MSLDPPQGVDDSSVAVKVCHFPVQVGKVHCYDFSMVLHWRKLECEENVTSVTHLGWDKMAPIF